MASAISTFLPAVVIGGIAGGLYFWVYRINRRHKQNLPIDIERIDKAIELEDLETINEVGMRLVYNRYLRPEHLKPIVEKLDKIEGWKDELPELSNAIYNKQLGWTKDFPYMPRGN